MGFKRELVLNGMRNYGNDKRKVIYFSIMSIYKIINKNINVYYIFDKVLLMNNLLINIYLQ